MNFAVTALVGLSLAQPAAPDYYPMSKRSFTVPIDYPKEKSHIRMVQLFVSRDQGATWPQEAEVTPDREGFVYTAKDDGVYWFHVVTVDMNGGRDPKNITTLAPALKVLVDTTRPVVQFTNVRRTGDEVVIEWTLQDRFPEENATRVYFRPVSAVDGFWQEVTLPATSKTGVKFRTSTSEAIVVRVDVKDLAGNAGEGQREIPAAGANANSSTSLSPGSSGGPTNPAMMNPPPPALNTNTAALPPPDALAPAAPVMPTMPAGPVNPTPMVAVPTQPVVATPTVPMNPIASGQGTNPQQPVAMSPPANIVVPAIPNTQPMGPAVLASGTGPASTPPPSIEMSRAQVINVAQFSLNYDVEQRGPSGLSRVDLWVTRDDGRSWMKWSQHMGRETPIPVHVALDVRGNPQLEGLYGFRLVAVSGAGLSDPAPVANDAPDLRVIVDVTSPVVKIFEPGSDPMQRDTLMIQWEAVDRNFGDDPILLEWSENPNGPWRPVVTGNDGVVQATAIGGAVARRVPNSGRYPWHVPMGLPAKVYLKVSARDAAGNTTEVMTPAPILVDLMKPRAKITGIGLGSSTGR